MLAKRIIPVLLQSNQALVKGTAFKSWRTCGHALQAVRIHQARGVDELIVLDIARTEQGYAPDFRLVSELTAECFMPITVGGGVRNMEDIAKLFHNGADKVAICTAAIDHPALITRAARHYGCQAIVAAIDVKDGMVWSRCGKRDAGITPVSWARELEALGAGEILLTSIERDGTLEGYDLDLVREVSAAVGIPVIANGGCGTYEHMREALGAGASAVAAGAMFQWTDQTPRGAAQYLAEHGIEVRL